MTQIEVDGQRYALWFQHIQRRVERNPGPYLTLSKDIKIARACTTVRIFQVAGDKPDPKTDYMFAEGTAFCSLKDQFCREIRRKTALSRALKSVSQRERRRAFWDKIFETGIIQKG